MESTTQLDEITSDGKNPGKKPRTYSDVWNFFIKKVVNNVSISECKGCKKVYKGGGKRNGTSSLRRHIGVCKSLKFHDVGQMFIDEDGKLKNQKMNSMIAREMLAAAIIKHDLPFSLVEYEGMRSFHKYLNPMFFGVSRNTIVSDINKLYLKEKAKLKQVLANIPNRVCLTSDVWTACNGEGYICLTAHYVDENWKLNNKILNFNHFPPPHCGLDLAAKVFNFLTDWGIEKKIFTLTLDNASSNDSMQNILRDQLMVHDGLLCTGEFFHIRCVVHILNLIVQDGIKLAAGSLFKIRESVKYVRGSESRMRKFEECVKLIGNIDTSVGLRLDVPTRWNSTYLMLDSVIRYKKVFSSLQIHDTVYKWCPTADDWKKAEKLCEFLQPFYETTNLISGSTYPTSNVYFMQVWKIESLLKGNLANEDKTLSDMCKKMVQKFDKYWSEYSTVLSFGAVFDPRMKLQMLEHLYAKVEPDRTKCHEKLLRVRSKLYQLFEEYVNLNKSSSSIPSSTSSHALASNPSGRSKAMGKRIFYDFKALDSQTTVTMGKSQLDLYLEEPKYDFTLYEDLDVLEHWKTQKNRYPELALMACDVLAIPITTVASESAFSIGGRVLTKYRSSMLSDNFHQVICTRNWLHGYESGDDDYGSASASTNPILSCEGSNALEDEDEDETDGGNEDDFDDVMVDEL